MAETTTNTSTTIPFKEMDEQLLPHLKTLAGAHANAAEFDTLKHVADQLKASDHIGEAQHKALTEYFSAQGKQKIDAATKAFEEELKKLDLNKTNPAAVEGVLARLGKGDAFNKEKPEFVGTKKKYAADDIKAKLLDPAFLTETKIGSEEDLKALNASRAELEAAKQAFTATAKQHEDALKALYKNHNTNEVAFLKNQHANYKKNYAGLDEAFEQFNTAETQLRATQGKYDAAVKELEKKTGYKTLREAREALTKNAAELGVHGIGINDAVAICEKAENELATTQMGKAVTQTELGKTVTGLKFQSVDEARIAYEKNKLIASDLATHGNVIDAHEVAEKAVEQAREKVKSKVTSIFGVTGEKAAQLETELGKAATTASEKHAANVEAGVANAVKAAPEHGNNLFKNAVSWIRRIPSQVSTRWEGLNRVGEPIKGGKIGLVAGTTAPALVAVYELNQARKNAFGYTDSETNEQVPPSMSKAAFNVIAAVAAGAVGSKVATGHLVPGMTGRW